MINTIIFDLDGTLVDSLEDLADTVNILLNKRGYPAHELDQYRYFVGNGVIKLIERALPQEHKDEVMVLKQEFDEKYSLNCLNKTNAYPGVNELLEKLKKLGFNLAVVTNKPQEHVKKNEVIYIGDSDVDIQTAKNAKVKSIGVAWGFRGARELKDSGADYVVDQADEILEVIDDWSK